jgi:hypothetical protein
MGDAWWLQVSGARVQALVTDIVPDSKVRAAMNDINASQRLRCVPPMRLWL